MPNIVETGYLEDGYLEGDYLVGNVRHGVWSQVERRIDSTHHVKQQIARTIDGALHNIRSQVDRKIAASHSVRSQVSILINSEHDIRTQIARQINTIRRLLEQVDRSIGNTKRVLGQADRAISSLHNLLEQVSRRVDFTHSVFSQVERQLLSTGIRKHEEVSRGSVLFIDHCHGYLGGPYLEDDYLLDDMCAQVRSQIYRRLDVNHTVHEQIERRIDATKHIKEQVARRIDSTKRVLEQVNRRLDKTHNARSQIQRRIDSTKHVKEQIERRIDALHSIHEQIDRLRSTLIHSQITQVLYNTTNLRILCDFSSRGTSGTNWTANSTEPGDFSVLNLNTDIVEQVWRSATGVKTGLVLTVDTEVTQGVFVDTLGILNHNMTTSASILWEASNDAGFSSIGFSEILTSARTNIYWVAPTLPTSSYRYWRFVISDGTNTADYIQWGTVVFGSSTIFQGECFVDRVVRGTTHFADRIQTEGFTNVSNDRAIKYNTTLEFRNLNFLKGNYQRLRDIFDEDRTSFKCLWIPTPQYPSRFAVFGKLRDIPNETHNNKSQTIDYVDLEITVDEAL